MELLPIVFSSGWASGVNAYATVLVLGLFGRFTDVHAFPVPDALTRTDVLVVAALLYAVEFVADKIPYLDSGWDVVSTAIRPSVGAVIALLVSGDASGLDQALYVTLGGGTALLSHLAKAGLRLAINASPEPFTNIGASVTEDSAVVTVVTLAVFHPWWALGVAAALLVLTLILVFLLLRYVRRGWRRWNGKRRPPPPTTTTTTTTYATIR
ncbi:MAG: DUF4126 domain-containing protein [Actinobacteria bacterium]|nr:DUF4126 domain-containing protein [Actinomycetota bacterium]